MSISSYRTGLELMVDFPNELITQTITYLPKQDATNFGQTCRKAYCLIKANTMLVLYTNAQEKIIEVIALKDRVKDLRGHLANAFPYSSDNQGLTAQVWRALNTAAREALGENQWSYTVSIHELVQTGYYWGSYENLPRKQSAAERISQRELEFDIENQFPTLYALAHSYIDLNGELQDYCKFAPGTCKIVDGKLFHSVVNLEELQKTIAKCITAFPSGIQQCLETQLDDGLFTLLQQRFNPLCLVNQECTNVLSNVQRYMIEPWNG